MLMKYAIFTYFTIMKSVVYAYFMRIMNAACISFIFRIPLASLLQTGYNKGYALSKFL